MQGGMQKPTYYCCEASTKYTGNEHHLESLVTARNWSRVATISVAILRKKCLLTALIMADLSIDKWYNAYFPVVLHGFVQIRDMFSTTASVLSSTLLIKRHHHLICPTRHKKHMLFDQPAALISPVSPRHVFTRTSRKSIGHNWQLHRKFLAVLMTVVWLIIHD